MIQHLDWLATAYSLWGVHILRRSQGRAVVTWLVGNVIWATWALVTENYALFTMQVVLSALHVRTLLTWRAVQNA